MRSLALLMLALSLWAPGRAHAEPPYYYLIPQAIEDDVRVTALSRLVNYSTHAGTLSLKAGALAYHGHPMLGLAMIGYGLSHFPVLVAGTSIFDLAIRQYVHNSRLLGSLDDAPGVQKVHLLSGGALEMHGIVPRALLNRSVVLLETKEPLPEAILKGEPHPDWHWAKPIALTEQQIKRSSITYTLNVDGKPDWRKWKVNLGKLKEGGVQMRNNIRNRWTDLLAEADKNDPPWWKKMLMLAHGPPPDKHTLTAELKLPGQDPIPLSVVGSSGDIYRLLRVGTLRSALSSLGIWTDAELHMKHHDTPKPNLITPVTRAVGKGASWVGIKCEDGFQHLADRTTGFVRRQLGYN